MLGHMTLAGEAICNEAHRLARQIGSWALKVADARADPQPSLISESPQPA